VKHRSAASKKDEELVREFWSLFLSVLISAYKVLVVTDARTNMRELDAKGSGAYGETIPGPKLYRSKSDLVDIEGETDRVMKVVWLPVHGHNHDRP
jgi:hypothetical protein